MEIIQTILNDKDATRELAKSNGDNLLFHTSHSKQKLTSEVLTEIAPPTSLH